MNIHEKSKNHMAKSHRQSNAAAQKKLAVPPPTRLNSPRNHHFSINRALPATALSTLVSATGQFHFTIGAVLR